MVIEGIIGGRRVKETQELFHYFGNLIWVKLFQNKFSLLLKYSFGSILKSKHTLAFDSGIPIISIYPSEMKSYIHI